MEKPLKYVKGVGEKRAELLRKLKIENLYDLVHYYPRDYLDMSSQNIVSIRDIVPGNTVCFSAIIGYDPTESMIRRGMTIYKTVAVDEDACVHITIFNSKYLADSLHQGEEYIFYGKVTLKGNQLEMTNPIIEKADVTHGLKPVYPLTAGLSSKIIGKIMKNGLDLYIGDELRDVIPEDIRREYSLCHPGFALRNVHFPACTKDLYIARRRLIFEELLTLQLGIRQLKGYDRGTTDKKANREYCREFVRRLPFTLTGAQKRVIGDCLKDMTGDKPMNRLIQGDVGSGKTAVAAALIYTMAKSGYQCAFMAPTEILAKQHYATFESLMKGTDLRFEVLTGSTPKKSKDKIKAALREGSLDFVIGTHAILTEDVEFASLGLIVTDEQHRFGVNQRGILSGKGDYPHTLVMSATPIPRTLSLIIYGDLDISVIDELPKGRQKISTYCVDSSYRKRIYTFIKKHLDMGLQAYIVCPLVEEGEEISELTAATEYAKVLAEKDFKSYRVGLLHGKMKPKAKQDIMESFVNGETQLLVSTTVIEVGVDVPNSVIMVIENAERFGLSQLHQLRGRVGRGSNKSYCILISDAEGENARARLETMCHTNDGFAIADKDLELRGPGDFFGSRQHGLPEMKIASITENMDIVYQAKSACEKILEADPTLSGKQYDGLKQSVRRLFYDKENLALN